jgi:hypothetical protein
VRMGDDCDDIESSAGRAGGAEAVARGEYGDADVGVDGTG